MVGTPAKPIVEVSGEVFLRELTAQLVRCRKHDLPVQGLHRIPTCDEAICQVIQQFRVRRTLPQLPEVARSGNNPTAKMMVPNAIDHYSGGQRVACDSSGKFEPSTPLMKWLGLSRS